MHCWGLLWGQGGGFARSHRPADANSLRPGLHSHRYSERYEDSIYEYRRAQLKNLGVHIALLLQFRKLLCAWSAPTWATSVNSAPFDPRPGCRHVILPPDIAQRVPKNHLLSEVGAACACAGRLGSSTRMRTQQRSAQHPRALWRCDVDSSTRPAFKTVLLPCSRSGAHWACSSRAAGVSGCWAIVKFGAADWCCRHRSLVSQATKLYCQLTGHAGSTLPSDAVHYGCVARRCWMRLANASYDVCGRRVAAVLDLLPTAEPLCALLPLAACALTAPPTLPAQHSIHRPEPHILLFRHVGHPCIRLVAACPQGRITLHCVCRCCRVCRAFSRHACSAHPNSAPHTCRRPRGYGEPAMQQRLAQMQGLLA